MIIIKNILKTASWLWTALHVPARSDVIVLMYHRVTGDMPFELDISFMVFKAQMVHLASLGAVISLEDAVSKLQRGERFERTHYVITFDDAFEDFFTSAFPLLEELKLPVTLYVPTGFIENPENPPISRKKFENSEKLKPVTWDMLKEIAQSSLVTIGSHTHTHRELPSLNDREVLEELEICDSILLKKLGKKIQHFAYPRGVWDYRIEDLVKNKYSTVTLAGGGTVLSSDFLSCRIPRVPVMRSDGLFWFKSRLANRLIHEDIFVAAAKNLIRKLDRKRAISS